MNSNTQTNLIYYGVTTLISAPLIYAFIIWLEWPLLAGVIFGGALYLHILNMSKHAKEYFGKLKKESYEQSSVLEKIRNKFGFATSTESERS